MWEWDGRVRWLVMGLLAALLFGAGIQYGRWQERKAWDNRPRVITGSEADGGTGASEALTTAATGGAATPTAGSSETAATAAGGTAAIQVHVTGAVQRPGVYELKAGARVNEAVSLAGLLPEADPNALNLAAPLHDGQQVIVPRQGEAAVAPAGISPATAVAPGAGSAAGASAKGAKVNLNTATLEELDTLPGIGPTLAQRIIDYRNQKGPFRTIEDVQNVSGIGPGRFEDIKDFIIVN